MKIKLAKIGSHLIKSTAGAIAAAALLVAAPVQAAWEPTRYIEKQ